MRLQSTQWFGGNVTINKDTVFAAMDVPPEGLLNGAGGECSMVMDAPIVIKEAKLYDLAGFLVPAMDPEESTTYEQEWNQMVEKADDASATSIRITPISSSTTPIWEPGEVRWGDLSDMNILKDDRMWYKNRRMVTFAKRPIAFVDATPDTYVPTDFVEVSSDNNRRFTDVAAYAMFGVSVPSVDDTASTLKIPAENTREWMWLKYAKQMLEFAYAFMLNSTDGAGDDPWELATLFLEEQIAPPIFQPATPVFHTGDIDILGKITFDISVPGERKIGQVSGGT